MLGGYTLVTGAVVVLVGRRGTSGDGVYWQDHAAGEISEVLTMVFPEQVATDAAVPDVSLPGSSDRKT